MSLQDYRDSLEPELILPLASELVTDMKPAEYVLSRSSSTWRSSTADGISSHGVIRVTLAAEQGWLAPETVRVQMTVNNLAPISSPFESPLVWNGGGHVPSTVFHDLQPASGGAGFIQRVRVLCAGTLVEDISDYGRLSEMFLSLSSEDKVLNQDISDFPSIPVGGVFHNTSFKKGIPGGKSRTVSFPLSVCGMFNTLKYVPLKFCPITLEIVIAPVSVCLAQGHVNMAYDMDPDYHDSPQYATGNDVGRAVDRSQQFNITNFQIKGDVVMLDSGIDEQLKQSMMNGNKMTLRLPTYTTDSMNLSGTPNPTLMMSRSLNSIRAVWVTFYAAGKSAAGLHTDSTGNSVSYGHLTEANSFHTPKEEQTGGNHPRGAYSLTTDDLDLTAQLAVGHKLFPDFPMTCPSEMYESLLRAMGVHASNHTSTSLRSREYRTGDRFVLAWNLERAPQFSSLSGLAVTNGENIQVRLQNMSNAHTEGDSGRHALTKAFVTLEHDIMLEIQASGVSVKS